MKLNKDRIYSRLYGYTYKLKIVSIVRSEAEIIQFIFNMLIEHKNIATVKSNLDFYQFRNRSKKRFSISEIKGMIRPIYAGITVGFLGFNITSRFYQPIVSIQTYKKARRILESINNAPIAQVPKAS